MERRQTNGGVLICKLLFLETCQNIYIDVMAEGWYELRLSMSSDRSGKAVEDSGIPSHTHQTIPGLVGCANHVGPDWNRRSRLQALLCSVQHNKSGIPSIDGHGVCAHVWRNKIDVALYGVGR